MDTPPPLPPRAQVKSFYHTAATISLYCIPLALIVTFFSNVALSGVDPHTKHLASLVCGMISGVILLAGIVSGIIALFGIPRYGTKGILFKALLGSLVPLLLIALAIPAIMHAKTKAMQVITSAAFDAQLSAVVAEVNAQKGKMIDKDIKLDGAEALPGKILLYKYTLLNLTRSQLPSNALQSVRPKLVAMYKSNPDMKAFRDNGVTLKYRYSDSAGELIGEIIVSPGDL